MYVGNTGPGLGQSQHGDGVERGNGISIVLIIGDPTEIKKYINKREKTCTDLMKFILSFGLTFHYLKLLSFLYNYRSMHI
jgi:hypothetical protein